MKPTPTPEQIRKACRDHCQRIPGYNKLPEAEQEKIYRAMLEIAGA